MRNRHALLAAVACGILSLSAAATRAAAQAVPPGSYQQTCSGIEVEGLKLRAGCRGKGATTGEKLLGAGEPFYYTDPLENFYECDGDISNNDSKLRCNRNPSHPRLKQARAAIDNGTLGFFGRKADDDQDYRFWLGEMFKAGLLPRFYAGLSDREAGEFFSKFLARPEQGNRRAQAIERAFKDVYGFGASPKDVAHWNAQMLAGRGGYFLIVIAERPKLNTDKVIRRMMIQSAYKKAMGRNPTPADFDYWQPRNEIFKEVVEAARNFLHSPGGAKDLAETVARALEAKTGGKPTIEQIKSAVIKYAQSKAIFDEM